MKTKSRSLSNLGEKNSSESKLQLLSEVASIEITETIKNKFDYMTEELQVDFDDSIKSQLINVLKEVDNTTVSVTSKDDYLVKVSLKDDSTYAFAPRRFAWAERLQIRQITDDLLVRGIIQNSSSPYCSRVVPVRKRNGSLRLCVDLRPLNDRVIKQKYPFPLIEDCLSRLGDKSVFSLLDLKDGFHQIKIHPDHTKYFSFATPDGQFEYTRLPFGFCESPAEFQKRLVQILQTFIRADKVVVYIDDILIPSNTVEENLATIKTVLLKLKQHGFKLNLTKCCFLRTSIEYLRYTVSAKGITLTDRHVDAVRKFPIPVKTIQVQRFLGLTNFFRKFIPNYAIIAKPLHNLLRKNIEFNFDTKCQQAFQILKESLTSYPVLSLYNPQFRTELHTDASSVALAAILLQKQPSGNWSAIAYYSQATNQAEAKYHSFELEMLAVVKSIERFHIYLYGLLFTVITDCHALVYALKKAHLNPRIARWTIRLQSYDFQISHRPGNKMSHVDALSRIVALVESWPLEKELTYRQLQDSKLKQISHQLETGDHDKYSLIEGLIYRKCLDKPRFVIPESMINDIIRTYHVDMAHCGPEKVIQGISANYWFPSMRKRVQEYVENCLICLLANSSTNSREGEMQIMENVTIPLQVLHADHFGPLIESSKGYRHILLVVDAFTRYTWLFPVKSTSSKETIDQLLFIFNSFGFPQEIVTDRGTAFSSHEFKELLANRNIRHRLIAVAAPWANGLVERVNKFLKSSLKKVVETQSDWSSHIFTIQYVTIQ